MNRQWVFKGGRLSRCIKNIEGLLKRKETAAGREDLSGCRIIVAGDEKGSGGIGPAGIDEVLPEQAYGGEEVHLLRQRLALLELGTVKDADNAAVHHRQHRTAGVAGLALAALIAAF